MQSNLCTTATLGTQNLWPLLTGGRCSEVPLCYKQGKQDQDIVVAIRRYVVVSSGSTTQTKIKPFLKFFRLKVSTYDISERVIGEDGLHVDRIEIVRSLQGLNLLSVSVHSLARKPKVLKIVWRTWYSYTPLL